MDTTYTIAITISEHQLSGMIHLLVLVLTTFISGISFYVCVTKLRDRRLLACVAIVTQAMAVLAIMIKTLGVIT